MNLTINYNTADLINMNSIGTTLNIHEMQSMTTAEITVAASAFIGSTKNM